MKTLEELNALKTEFEAVTLKLEGLTDEEMETVTGGKYPWIHQRMARSGNVSPDDNIILKEKRKGLSDEELTSVSGGYVGDQTDRTWEFG